MSPSHLARVLSDNPVFHPVVYPRTYSMRGIKRLSELLFRNPNAASVHEVNQLTKRFELT